MNIFDNDEDIIKTDVLKARGNTLVFYNTIYQISNISEVKTINLSTEKNMPVFYWAILAAGLVLLVPQQVITSLLGFAAIGLFAYLVYNYFKNRVDEKYGLYISLNSGRSTVISSKDLEFVQKVVITLINIMNKQNAYVNFDFSSRTINEVSASDGSVVVNGEVNGDIATNV